MYIKYLIQIIICITTVFFISSCQGNKSSSNSNNPKPNLSQEKSLDKTIIQGSESLLNGYTGVKAKVNTLEVSVLSSSVIDDTSRIIIKSNPGLTGGSTDELVGGTFLTFGELPKNSNNRALINASQKISVVNECSYQTRICEEIPFSLLSDGSVSFKTSESKFYAIEK